MGLLYRANEIINVKCPLSNDSTGVVVQWVNQLLGVAGLHIFVSACQLESRLFLL